MLLQRTEIPSCRLDWARQETQQRKPAGRSQLEQL